MCRKWTCSLRWLRTSVGERCKKFWRSATVNTGSAFVTNDPIDARFTGLNICAASRAKNGSAAWPMSHPTGTSPERLRMWINLNQDWAPFYSRPAHATALLSPGAMIYPSMNNSVHYTVLVKSVTKSVSRSVTKALQKALLEALLKTLVCLFLFSSDISFVLVR